MNNKDNYSILVVGDVIENVNLIITMLNEVGYKVHTAMGGEQALKSVNASPPDLILLDIMMPDIDGFEVCRRIKASESTKDIPIIFVTAIDSIDNALAGFELGAIDFIAKPVSLEEARLRIALHLKLMQQKKELKQAITQQKATIERFKILQSDHDHQRKSSRRFTTRISGTEHGSRTK